MERKSNTEKAIKIIIVLILINFGVYTLISVSSSFSDIPADINANVPVMQPLPMFVVIAVILLALVLIDPKTILSFLKRRKDNGI